MSAHGSPLRTLLFSTLYPSAERPIHGIFVETRLRELLKTGQVHTRVMAPVPWFPSGNPRWGEYARMARTPAREVRHGVEILHPRYLVLPKVGMTLAPFLLALACVRPVQRAIREGGDFDLIDAHYYYPDGVAAAWLARWFRKPLTITARGTDLNLIPQHTLPRQMIQWAASHAQASIGVCAALMDVLRDLGVEGKRLHVMRNGVDLEHFKPEPPVAARQRLGIDGSPVLLSVGHLIERKGHHLAIAAMPDVLRQQPQARLIIIGEGPERPALEALARQLGVQGRVRLTGALPHASLPGWYSAADMLILASSREGWANVLLEAMACGTPVVATRIWGTPEVVSTSAAGLLVDDRNAAALAQAVLHLLETPRDRGAVRRHAEGFSWAQTSQQQLDLFRQLVHGGHLAGADATGAGHA
jgi:glycosyltransferase involved in cell wall biosynthesis